MCWQAGPSPISSLRKLPRCTATTRRCASYRRRSRVFPAGGKEIPHDGNGQTRRAGGRTNGGAEARARFEACRNCGRLSYFSLSLPKELTRVGLTNNWCESVLPKAGGWASGPNAPCRVLGRPWRWGGVLVQRQCVFRDWPAETFAPWFRDCSGRRRFCGVDRFGRVYSSGGILIPPKEMKYCKGRGKCWLSRMSERIMSKRAVLIPPTPHG